MANTNTYMHMHVCKRMYIFQNVMLNSNYIDLRFNVAI